MRLIAFGAALVLGGLIVLPAQAQTTGTQDPGGTTTGGTSVGGTTTGGSVTTATPIGGTATATASNAGAFDRLSPGNQKMATALFDAQRVGTTGTSLSLDDIAAMKGSQGWGQVFKEMQTQGQLEGARTLGQVRSGHYQPPGTATPAGGGTGAGTGTGTGGETMNGGNTSGAGTQTGTAASTSPARVSSQAAGRATPIAITNGSGRTTYIGNSSNTRAGAAMNTTSTAGARSAGMGAGGGNAPAHANAAAGMGAGAIKTSNGSAMKAAHAGR